MTPFRLAWLDLARHRGATALALAVLACAIGCAGILYRLDKVADSRFGRLVQAGDVIVGAKAGNLEILLGCLNGEGPYPGFFPYRLYVSLLNHVKISTMNGTPEKPYHRVMVPLLHAGTHHGRRIIGANESLLQLRLRPGNASIAVREGRWPALAGEIVLGHSFARSEGLRVGDTLAPLPWGAPGGSAPAANPLHLKVSGVLSQMGNVWDDAAFTGMEDARKLMSRGRVLESSIWGEDVLHYIIFEMEPGREQALESVVNQRTVAQVVSIPEAEARLRDLTGTGRAMSLGVLISTLVLAFLALAGLSLGSSEERQRQLAVLQAIGRTRRDLVALLLWRSGLLYLGGWALGACLDGAAFPWLRKLLGSSLPSPSDHPSTLMESAPVWGLLCLLFLSVSLIPYARFCRTSPVESLQGLS